MPRETWYPTGRLGRSGIDRCACEWNGLEVRSKWQAVCPGCKPVSVPLLEAAVIRLGLTLLPGSSNLPGSLTERAAPSPLFGLAPHGVFTAIRITPDAVRSYRTFSPLPSD